MIFGDIKSKKIFSLIILFGIIGAYVFSFSWGVNELKTAEKHVLFDLNEIKKRGKLIALTDNSSTSFYIYKGDSMGYEYDLLNAFAKDIGVTLEIIVAKDMNTIFDLLNSGEVDIVAANLTVTKERSEIVNFSEPLMLTRQMLIQRKPEGWENMKQEEMDAKLIRNTIDLKEKTIHVRKTSSFYSRLNSLSEEIGEKINVLEVPGDNYTEQLISKVASGEIDYTIADENMALTNQAYYPNIDAETPISFPQKISWAMRQNAPLLEVEVNDWIRKKKESDEIALAYKKYFKKPKKLGARGESKTLVSADGRISEYDELIKIYSEKIGWDWRLLASMVCQESQFSATAQSWAGANGLMQLVPGTAMQYGIDSANATAEQSLQAGTSFILDLDKYWISRIPDKDERIKFVLASYNVGLGHVIDARKIAIKQGNDPDIWFSNVENAILQKSNPAIYNDSIVKFGYCRGQETYLYVREILNRYGRYKRMLSNYESLAKN